MKLRSHKTETPVLSNLKYFDFNSSSHEPKSTTYEMDSDENNEICKDLINSMKKRRLDK